MRKLYLLDLGISDCDSHKVDRFYAIMASFYTWSLRLFDNTMVIQTEEKIEQVGWALDECIARLAKEQPISESLFGDRDWRDVLEPFAIEDYAICELHDHLIVLKDKETSVGLKEMLNPELSHRA